MRKALCELARRLDVDPRDAQLLHLANNAVYALPRSGLVVRITRSHSMYGRVHKVAKLGAWFPTVNAPTIRLASHLSQPVLVDTLLATVWKYLPPTGDTPTISDLGIILREWHALPPPDGLPQWNPTTAARHRIADAEGLSAKDRDWLLAWCDNLEPQIFNLNEKHPANLIHGDAHVGNLLQCPAGRIVFCDFDSTCLGPPQVDLAATAAAETWFDGRTGSQDTLASAYGYDVTTDPDWPIFRSARELAYVVGGVPLLKSTPGVAEEFQLRIRSVKNRDESATWTPYAHFGHNRRSTASQDGMCK